MSAPLNPETTLSLDDCVAEVLGLLTGMDLQYRPELDRYQAITRQLNRALRANALEHEWSWYAATEHVGQTVPGQQSYLLRAAVRPRVINDDAVRLVRPRQQHPVLWAYFLPRDALHKYADRGGLWAAVTRNVLTFSRPFARSERGLDILVPVMREPTMFRLPPHPEGQNDPLPAVPQEIRDQPLDFQYPDLVVLRAATYYAMTDPIMQPRVQTLEQQTKELMYQIIERDDRNTDSPYLNEFFVPVQNGIAGPSRGPHPHHPHADERR